MTFDKELSSIKHFRNSNLGSRATKALWFFERSWSGLRIDGTQHSLGIYRWVTWLHPSWLPPTLPKPLVDMVSLTSCQEQRIVFSFPLGPSPVAAEWP